MSDAATRFQQHRQALADAFFKDGRVTAYLSGHSAAADQAIIEMAKAVGLTPQIALLALGGYGRKELFPYSDLDVMILVPDDDYEKSMQEHIERFIAMLWDIGLNVGHCVRTVERALQESAKDITVQTALLEARCFWGNASLFDQLQKDFFKTLDPAAFFRAKELERTQRHLKHEDTPYELEPNIKESPGGLRDLQFVFWCSHAAGLGATPDEMLATGTLHEQEAYQLKEVYHALKYIRIYLHLIAKRHQDRLIFDIQTPLAIAAGYKDSATQLAGEALMKHYYLTAKTVYQLSSIFMQMLDARLFDEGRVREMLIDRTFISRGYTLDIIRDDAISEDPNALLRAFYILEGSEPLKRLSVPLQRALMQSKDLIDDHYRDAPENKRMFMQIMKMPHGVSHALIDLNRWGILGQFLPEFERIVGQMQHDLFHAYTVDQHTLRVVRNLRYFTRSEYAHEYPLCSNLMQSMKDNWRVVLAALLHDIGKGLGGRHEEKGAEIARRICQRFEIDPQTTDFIVFLVREHLTMSIVAQKQDISDPDVVKRFAQVVGDEERLNALYLLTVCDIRATGPNVWNKWKSQLLQDLYWQTLPLVRSEGAPDRDAFLLKRQREAKQMALSAGVDEKTLRSFWKTLTLQYYLRHTAESIAWQSIEISKVFPTDQTIVRTRCLPEEVGIEVLVYTPDQPKLFARILALLQKKRFSVLDARIYTTPDGHALDTFVISDNGKRDLEPLADKLVEELTDWINHPQPLPQSSKHGKLSRRSRFFPIQPIVNIEADDSGQSYILSITCMDRIGLLYDIANVLNRHGINLQTAKIMTMGERVEDVFLIDGIALKDLSNTVAIENELMTVLTPNI